MRLIDADAIGVTDFELVLCDGDYKELCKTLIANVESAPTIDAVPVVRCRECRYNGQPPDKGFAQCELDALIREPEFWCRAGQREDGDV